MEANGAKTKRIEELKDRVSAEVDNHRGELVALSHRIHDDPELGFREVKASAWLSDYLSGSGFNVERGISGMPTAFRAVYGRQRPAIAILAEYDALPGLGHGCGHNIIASIAVGAAVAARPAVDDLGGSVMVLGTPAEELHGGKITMIERGAFADLDAALIVHPGRRNAATEKTLACVSLDVEFFGREAHASANPEQGLNALEAMVLSFNSINSLRQHIRRQSRVHGIITDGGKAANIVPGHSAGSFLVRSDNQRDLGELKDKVLSCFEGAAIATGTRLEYRWGERPYQPLRSNQVIESRFAANLSSLGRRVDSPDETWGAGSTDMGNVSQVVPAIHATIAITTSPEATLHSPEFALAAASAEGDLGVIDGAKATAMTVVDLLGRPRLVEQAWREFSTPAGVAAGRGI
ncbi:MAG: M20 family metallopeptidase [Chloroflexi bacterium]|nr:M20 family metallopeptidase [Chloroflexota bacterium]